MTRETRPDELEAMDAPPPMVAAALRILLAEHGVTQKMRDSGAEFLRAALVGDVADDPGQLAEGMFTHMLLARLPSLPA